MFNITETIRIAVQKRVLESNNDLGGMEIIPLVLDKDEELEHKHPHYTSCCSICKRQYCSSQTMCIESIGIDVCMLCQYATLELVYKRLNQ